ncbi:MAG: peptide chain release factor N(5)-glutamine methyltransferase [Anaerolineaceae bacterium]
MNHWTVATALAEAREVFRSSDSPTLDAQTLLSKVLDQNRAWLLTHPEASLTDRQAAEFGNRLVRLRAGEPLPYVLGEWEFYGRSFEVAPCVLIPRPETELLVEQALGWLRAHPTRRQAADLGSGSGCIAVTLAAEISDLAVTAVDLSARALEITRRNCVRHGVEARVACIQGDLLAPLGKALDLIAANPPYIPSGILEGLEVAKHEPRLALDGGVDGLDVIRRILSGSVRRLAPGGLLLVEIEAGQGQIVREFAQKGFPRAGVQICADLAGNDRLLVVEREVDG